MKKKATMRILSLILSLLLLLSLWPASAFASSTAEETQISSEETQADQTDLNDLDNIKSDVSLESINEDQGTSDVSPDAKDGISEENSQDAKDGISDENRLDVNESNETDEKIDVQSMDDDLQREPIESIIAKDDEGNNKFYVTLFDSNDRIVDTTDPEQEKDNYYKSKEDAGEAGTVDLDAKLRVRFRMAEIIENSSENGIQEDVLYYMTLPNELVPIKEDSTGKVVVDPENPVSFFQSSDLCCLGGIYTEGDGYQLQLRFSNVEDQLNIAAEFQYDVSLSDQIEAGKKCTISYVPGGTLEFNTTPKKEEPEKEDESLSLSGQKDPDSADKINWTLTLTDNDMKLSSKRLKISLGEGSDFLSDYGQGTKMGDITGLSSVVITYKDGHSETLSANRMNYTAYSFYRNTSGFNPTITDNGSLGILGTAYINISNNKQDEIDLMPSSNGQILTNTLYIDMAALKSNSSNCGNMSGADEPDDIDLEICKYEFHFTSVVYDNYNISSGSYTASASMMDSKQNEELASASASVDISYGIPDRGTLSDTASDETNYFGIPSYIDTTYATDNKNYTGNYFSLQFAPQQVYKNNSLVYSNSTNAIFYCSYNSFFEGGRIDSTFKTLQIGDVDAWTFCARCSYSDIKGSSLDLLNYFVEDDPVAKYQILKVFENIDQNDYLLMYKSNSKVNGKYVYMFVDPGTRSNTYYSKLINGWDRLANQSDAKASDWKIHIFNAPAQNFKLSFKQSNGTAYADNKNTSGKATDSMLISNAIYGESGMTFAAEASYTINRAAASAMSGTWITEDTIFWEMSAYTKNISSWRSSRLYIRVPEGQELCIGGSIDEDPVIDLDGKEINAVILQYYDEDSSSWKSLNGSKSLYTGEDGSSITNDSNEPSIKKISGTDNIYYVDFGTIPSYDGEHIKIGFATRLTESNSSALSCQAELVTMNGETTEFGNTGSSRYPFKVSAEASAALPDINKSHEYSGHIDANGTEHIYDSWTITANLDGNSKQQESDLNKGTYKTGYNGIWTAHDDMKNSYAEDEKGNKLSIELAEFAALNEMTVWMNGDEKLFNLTEDDFIEVAEAKDCTKEFKNNDYPEITLTLTYKGNMKDGFDIKISGLNNASALSVDYATEFDQKALFDKASELGAESDQFITAVFMNGAHCGGSDSTKYQTKSEKVEHRLVAAIAINKSVEESPVPSELSGGYSAKYKIDTQIGYSGSDYVEIKDYILGYADQENEYSETDTDAIKALTNALGITELVVSATDVNGDEEVIYEGGEAADGSWEADENNNWNISFDYKTDAEHIGSLFNVKINTSDGSRIQADYHFTIGYKMTVRMDDPKDESFRDSDFFSGGTLRINNSSSATRTVNGSGTLTVDCKAGVSADYLADKIVNKSILSQNDDTTKWMIYDWTGTKGKNNITGKLIDNLTYNIDSFSYTDENTGSKVSFDQLSADEKSTVSEYLKELLVRNTSFRNVNLYYTDNMPTVDLSEEDLIYRLDESFGAYDPPNTYIDTAVDKAGLSHDIELTTGDGGFEASANKLKCDTYFAAVYETEIDWDNVYSKLKEDGYQQASITASTTNTVKNDQDSKKESSGNYIDLMDESIEKSLTSSDSANGISSWKIKAYTGPNKENDLIIKDEITLSSQDERISAAAQSALSIDPDSVVVKYKDITVYENGKAKGGWSYENIDIQIDGNKLNVVIKNTDESTVIFTNTTYTVLYDTVLDKDAYIQNGGMKDDQVDLNNIVMAEHGSFNASSEQSDEIIPDIPISADKSNLGYGSDGNDKTTSLWQTVACTNDAGRKNFILSDSVSLSEPDEKIQNAFKIQDLEIKIKTGQDEEKTYTSDNLPDGASLIEEGAGYSLTFAELPKDTTVTVTYAIHFDKDAYIAAGGESDVDAELKNAFSVSSNDGYTAGKEVSGRIEHSNGFSKEGAVSSEKSENGNPLIEWKINVNLYEFYSADELSKLKEVSISDELSAILMLKDESISLRTEDDLEIPKDKYMVEQTGNVLKVTLTDPVSYPAFDMYFETECGASVSGLVNNASLSIDGKKIEETSSDNVGRLDAANQYGWIKSMKVPEFTPIAYKYLDNELCTEKGIFDFSIVQVDEDGNIIDGGYQDTAQNDENGKITFSKIIYRDKPVEGTYYYQIRETTKPEAYTYTVDERVFTICVNIIASNDRYIVSYTVVDPKNYDEVRFDNSTIKSRDFTVTKKWDDQDDEAGLRPKAITVYLLNNGERYNNMSVTLSEENNWTYTWNDLPIANGNYSVEEAEVEYYTAGVVTEDWNSVITNTYTGEEPETPDKPNEETPKTPDNPNKETPKNEDNISKAVQSVPKTGDSGTDYMILWMLVMIIAIYSGIKVIKKKK